jgi:hypothetical protein
MLVKSVILDVYLPTTYSLKSKRNIIKSLSKRVKDKFNVSVAEVGYLDQWQRTSVGISMVANEGKYLQKQFAGVIRFIEDNYPDIEILNIQDFV